LPKFSVDETKETGKLVIEPDDISGKYDYIPDIESMSLPDDRQIVAARRQIVELAKDPNIITALGAEGYRLKLKELLEDFYEQLGIKDADRYFERLRANGQEQALAGGAGGAGPTPLGAGVIPQQGMARSTPPVAREQNTQFVG